MATEPTINCPNCNTEIKLTESLAAPLIQETRHKFEEIIAKKESEVSKRESAIRVQQEAISDTKKVIDEEVYERIKLEKEKISIEESKKAKLSAAADLEAKGKELSELQDILAERNAKLEEAQKSQADLIRKQRALDDAKRELDLTIEKRVQASITEIRGKAKQEAEDSFKLKVTEKEEQISSMQKQIEDLKRKAEQGSQQLQGEALEIALEGALREKFPYDTIEAVAKGELGADILQRVISPTGKICGSILWETKRTKNWSDGWLPKLRTDMRTAKADVAVLVSNTLHASIDSFGIIEGVWVTKQRHAIPLVIALRGSLIEIANSRIAQEGQGTKMELVYQYLTGPKFRHRVEAIVEKFSEMQTDLDRERKSMTRMWAKRDTQIQTVLESTVGMYGDLQGIAGHAFQEIEGLELPLLETDNWDES